MPPDGKVHKKAKVRVYFDLEVDDTDLDKNGEFYVQTVVKRTRGNVPILLACTNYKIKIMKKGT